MIDRAGLKEAIEWKKTTDPEQIRGASLLCPKDLSLIQKLAVLEATRPEFYGRTARIIDRGLTKSFESRKNRGELGLIRWNHEIVAAKEIKSMMDLDYALAATLEFDMKAAFDTMRTPDVQGEIPDFEEYMAIDALARNRGILNENRYSDILTSFGYGVDTATSHIRLLITPMFEIVKDEPDAVAIITKSHSPIKTLASLSIEQLALFQDYVVINLDTLSDLFIIKDTGKIDFKDSIYELDLDGTMLKDVESEHKPVLGCPILFNGDQTQKLWRWGVDIADKSGLL